MSTFPQSLLDALDLSRPAGAADTPLLAVLRELDWILATQPSEEPAPTPVENS